MAENVHSIVGPLGIISMPGCEEIAAKVDYYIKQWRGDEIETYNIPITCPRFGSGEAKGLVKKSVRGHDIFIICDVFNHGIQYRMYNQLVPMSPDDHFQDLKRIIAAMGGKSRRITVIMPMLYEGRQHRRSARESLDCAMALQELVAMGVTNIITFDAHDGRVCNAIPLSGFENVHPTYQMLKAIKKAVPDIKLDNENVTIVSPDEGGMSRCIYYSSVLGVDLGMFYKRRNYSIIVNGRNPIEAHEYLGNDISGKDVIIVDDMISSGDSVLDIGKKLKERNARRIFVFASFGLFVEGFENFDKAYEEGYIDKVFTTNLVYAVPELLDKPWYCRVDMSKYIAYIIDTLNHDASISTLLAPIDKIKALLGKE
ncbi:MAG: ribose-phosphate pyrophosphokinase [Clostridia bacterium]|nr:ribose-phosphate pyrophosphokinase [Clostridia bacterium]